MKKPKQTKPRSRTTTTGTQLPANPDIVSALRNALSESKEYCAKQDELIAHLRRDSIVQDSESEAYDGQCIVVSREDIEVRIYFGKK